MDADGSNVVGRTLGLNPPDLAGGFSFPAWSPDGAKLAVATGGGYGGSIYVLSAVDDGTAPIRVQTSAADPAWSPDGARIAFVSLSEDFDYGEDFEELRVMNADGSDVRAVTGGDSGSIQRPNWSPDGQRIAFSKCLNGCDVYTVAADGSSLKRLTSLGTALRPAWTPDGDMIGFTLAGASIAVAAADPGTDWATIAAGSGVAWRPRASAAAMRTAVTEATRRTSVRRPARYRRSRSAPGRAPGTRLLEHVGQTPMPRERRSRASASTRTLRVDDARDGVRLPTPAVAALPLLRLPRRPTEVPGHA
jgi:Tol biopolymer transport system component